MRLITTIGVNNHHEVAFGTIQPGQENKMRVFVLWAEHLTSPSKRGVGTLSNVSAFNHERAPMSCLQRLDALDKQ